MLTAYLNSHDSAQPLANEVQNHGSNSIQMTLAFLVSFGRHLNEFEASMSRGAMTIRHSLAIKLRRICRHLLAVVFNPSTLQLCCTE